MKLSSCFARLRWTFVGLSAVFLVALAAPRARAQGNGSVTGVVSDASGYFIPGATVRVQGTSLSAVTDRDGRFQLDGVPAGVRRVTVDYLGYEPAAATVEVNAGARAELPVTLKSDVVTLDAFKVESIREGQSRAINQQRTANTIKNVISSDAIGNLPDRTVGEALGRLPGVNVVDDSFASVRGTAAKFNSVTLDGDRFGTSGNSVDSTSTPDDNRAVDLSLIPSEMVGGIEVIKALTPDMDVDSFGGTINLVTRSAFDLKERSLNGKVEYIYNQYRDKHGYAGSLTYMDVLNQARTLGISATLTYRKEDRYSDSYEMSYYDANAIPVGSSGSGTAGAIAAVGDQGLEAYDTRLNFNQTKKFGATVNLDWKLSPNTELHGRTFYENSEKGGGRYRNRARALSRWNPASTATLESGTQVRLANQFEDVTTKQDVLRFGVDGKTKLETGALDYGVRYGDSAAKLSRERYIFDLPSSTERRKYSWSLDRTDPMLPVLSITHIASGQNGLFTDLNDRRLSAIRLHHSREHEDDLTSNLDYAFNHDVQARRLDWKFGVKYRGKERTSRPTVRDFSPNVAPAYSAFTIVAEPRDMFQGTMATFGPYVSLPEVIGLYRANPAAFTAASGDEIVRVEARKYDVNEDILAGYGMATTHFERLEAIAGVRWEQTKTKYKWLADPTGPSSGSRRYDGFYPGLLLNYRVSPVIVGRLAYTHTLARPSYGDLIPYRVYADTQSESGSGALEPDDYPETNKVFLGNANLKAQQSENFDLSLEYYLPRAGAVSVAVFEKRLTDVIYRGQWKDPAVPNTIFFQDRNGSKGKVRGLELSWQQALTFLPGPLGGLGVNVNATFTKGSSVLSELVPNSAGTYREFNVDFLPEQPKKVYNAQVWWEKYGFTARVAMNYVDNFVRTSGGLTAFSMNDKATHWDASLSYRLSRNFTIYVEGRNLSKEVTSWYATSPSRPEDYSFTGATFSGGVKFRF